jgi:broad specificity phosphatase PhoE
MGRAVAVAETMIQRSQNSQERIALVTHGMFTNLLIKALFSQLPAPNIYYAHYNTAITRIDFYDNGTLGLRYLNRVNHLPPELITE